MSTVQDMIDRISDELDDSAFDAGGQALRAINDAVKTYRDKRFWFNQVIGKSFSLSGGAEYIAPTLSVTGISVTEPITTIDLLTIDDGTGANYWKVEIVDNSKIDAVQTGSITGRPQYVALVSDSSGTRLRFFPIPDQTYTPVVKALIRFETFTDGTGDNPWTNDAEILIRQAAKRIIMSDITREIPVGSPPGPAELSALSDLLASTRLRMGPSKMRADELSALQGRGRYDITSDTYW